MKCKIINLGVQVPDQTHLAFALTHMGRVITQSGPFNPFYLTHFWEPWLDAILLYSYRGDPWISMDRWVWIQSMWIWISWLSIHLDSTKSNPIHGYPLDRSKIANPASEYVSDAESALYLISNRGSGIVLLPRNQMSVQLFHERWIPSTRWTLGYSRYQSLQ